MMTFKVICPCLICVLELALCVSWVAFLIFIPKPLGPNHIVLQTLKMDLATHLSCS
uniref:Uncharacterized protein n=1 Tax=Rhizophora mucronata TaxID=61149 RepID=A0A2P2N9A0_RHIMU